MSRLQLALNVSDLDGAVIFYSKLFGLEPAKRRPGYANFAVAEPPLKLVLLEDADGRGAGVGGALNHLGVEVEDTDQVSAAALRLSEEGLATATEDATTCCYAVQDKVWVRDPDQVPWEIYAVLADAPAAGCLLTAGSMATLAPPQAAPEAPVLARLSPLDRFLPVWIFAAMGVGIGLGRAAPDLDVALDAVQVGGVSLPIALGLLLMMYPVLAKVRYADTRHVTADRRLLAASLVLNWLVGPAVMSTLAWLLLPDLPTYRTGLIVVGLARCIAMVLIWNDLSCGDAEAAAVLVAINAVFQIIAFAGLGYFYLHLLPGWLGLATTGIHIGIGRIALSVLVFLGVPLVAGCLTRTVGERTRGRDWYEHTFLPRIGPVALYGLLFTIVVLFALQGRSLTAEPGAVARIAVPLIAYFAIMFGGGFALGRRLGLGYPKTATLAFTAAGNNFELAIAVCIGAFGITSGEALAGVVGPLIEVPALVALVYASLWARRRCFADAGPSLPPPTPERPRPVRESTIDG